MNLTESNLITLDTELKAGQRVIRIGNSIIPVGVGGSIAPASNSFDFSAATAAASDVLSSKKFYNNQGELTTGTIQTVTASLDGNTVHIPKGYIAVSDSISVAVGADVTLGVVDSQGRFQALRFNGTQASNSGSAIQVQSYKTWNSTLPVPSPAPSAGMDFYKCASVDASNSTWKGYKAMQDPVTHTYSFESTVTSGLTYSSPVPAVGSIYNSDCSIRAILYHTAKVYLRDLPFSTDMEDTVVHDTPIASGGSVSISNGSLLFPSSGTNYIKYAGLARQPSIFSIVFWMKYGENNSSNNVPVLWGNELNESQTSYVRIPYEGTLQIGLQATYGNKYKYDSSIIDYTDWTLVSMVFSGSEYLVYLNTTLVTTISTQTQIPITRNLWFGSYYGYNNDHTFKGNIRGFRIIESAISAKQIQTIYESER